MPIQWNPLLLSGCYLVDPLDQLDTKIVLRQKRRCSSNSIYMTGKIETQAALWPGWPIFGEDSLSLIELCLSIDIFLFIWLKSFDSNDCKSNWVDGQFGQAFLPSKFFFDDQFGVAKFWTS